MGTGSPEGQKGKKAHKMEAIIRISIDNDLNETDKPYTATVSVETSGNWSLADEREYQLIGTSNGDLLNRVRDMLAGRAGEALVRDVAEDLLWMDDKAWKDGEPKKPWNYDEPEPEEEWEPEPEEEPEPEPEEETDPEPEEPTTLKEKLAAIKQAVTNVPAEGYAILKTVTMGDVKTQEDMAIIGEMRKALYIAEPEELEENPNNKHDFASNAIKTEAPAEYTNVPDEIKTEYQTRLTAVAWGLDALNHLKYMGLGRRLFAWPNKSNK